MEVGLCHFGQCVRCPGSAGELLLSSCATLSPPFASPLYALTLCFSAAVWRSCRDDVPEVRRERLLLLEHLRVRPRLQLRMRDEGGRPLRSVLADMQLRGQLQLRRRLQVRVSRAAAH